MEHDDFAVLSGREVTLSYTSEDGFEETPSVLRYIEAEEVTRIVSEKLSWKVNV
jgi:hypothetical protein